MLATKSPSLFEWYQRLIRGRSAYLERAREAASLTVPSLYPSEGETGAGELTSRYQSVGAEAVNGLSNKIVLALFPPGQSFFRLDLDPRVRADLERLKSESQDPTAVDQAKAEIDSKLAEQEALVLKEFETTFSRGDLIQGIRLMEVGGTVGFFVEDSGSMTLLKLEQLGLQRAGSVYSRVVVESFKSVQELPASVQEAAKKLVAERAASTDSVSKEKSDTPDPDEVAVYTGQFLLEGGDRYEVWQELSDGTPLGDRQIFDMDLAPILVVPWNQLPKEHYGRGMVEDFIGDFSAVEGLSRSITAAAAIAARAVGLVDPASSVDPQELNSAPNGSFVTGREGDVAFVQANKSGDIAAAQSVNLDIIARLRAAFLSGIAARRNGERVTAEEIRLVANELESSLGGIYSTLSRTLQYPLLLRHMRRLERNKTIKPLGDAVRPIIITGLEALGRQAEAGRVLQFVEVATKAFGPEGFIQNVKPRGFLRMLASAYGLAFSRADLFVSEQEAQQAAQAQAQQAALAAATEAAAKSAAGAGAKAYVEGATQPPAGV